MKEYVIPWCKNHSCYEPGTMVDIGMIRLELKRTKREKNNKWRVYMCIRTHSRYGVEDGLKRGVCVASFPGKFSLKEAQEYTRLYLSEFFLYAAVSLREANEEVADE